MKRTDASIRTGGGSCIGHIPRMLMTYVVLVHSAMVTAAASSVSWYGGTTPASLLALASTYDCTPKEYSLLDNLVLRAIIHPDGKEITMQVEYSGGNSWLGTAVSPTGFMIPNHAVVGLPDAKQVTYYELMDRFLGVGGVSPLTGTLTPLSGQSIVQPDSSTTVMTFTRPVTDPANATLTQIAPGSPPIRMIFAVGSDNTLNYHAMRGNFTLTFSQCVAKSGASGGGGSSSGSSGSNHKLKVGDQLCVEGYIMDNFCIDRGTLFDNPTIRTLSAAGPVQHTVHCMLDVPDCVASGYTILQPNGTANYSVAYQLDKSGSAQIRQIMSQVGVCDACNGTQQVKNGFYAALNVQVVALSSNSTGGVPVVTILGGQYVDPNSTEAASICPATGGLASFNQQMCVEGYIMDNYCIDRGTLFDNPTIATLSADGPVQHSVHCLLDVPDCVASGYTILKPNGTGHFAVAYQLDQSGNAQIRQLASQVGVCDACNGTQQVKKGLYAALNVQVVAPASNSTGGVPVVTILDAEYVDPTSSIAGSVCPAKGGVGKFNNQLCVEGYIMDNYCIDRGTLFDNPTIATLSADGPVLHTVHCMLDVPDCVASGYTILKPNGTGHFAVAYQLDQSGSAQIRQLMSQVGVCGACNGTQQVKNGFYAALNVEVVALSSNSTGGVPVVTILGGMYVDPTSSVAGSVCPADGSLGKFNSQMCVEGYIMDNYCIDRGTLFDNPTIATLSATGPVVHTVHCMLDVPDCVASGYTILQPNGTANFSVAYQLDKSGSAQIRQLMSQVGVCGACNGTQQVKNGYYAALNVQVVAFPSNSTGGVPVVTILGGQYVDPTSSAAGSSCPADGSLGDFNNNGLSPAPPGPSPAPTMTASNMISTMLESDLHLFLQVDEKKGTATVELTHAKPQGWLGFGTSPGGMIGSEVVLGLPSSNANPVMYRISERAVSGINPIPGVTLVSSSVTQNSTHTVLKYVRPLAATGIRPILADGENLFVYAVGSDNTLGYHQSRNVFKANLASGTSASGITKDKVYKKWVAHGFLMAIAWAILVPLAVGSSMLRSLLPKGVWFKLHRAFNGLAIVAMVAGFTLAVQNVNSLNEKNFQQVQHRRVGLIIFILALVQAIVAGARPHLPTHHDHSAVNSNTEGEEGEQEKGLVPKHDADTPTATAKSTLRVVWEIKHRLLGLCLLGLAWWNCYTGIQRFLVLYPGLKDPQPALWGVVGGLSGLILLGKLVLTAMGK